MKNFKNYLAYLGMCALLLTSCSKDESAVTNDEVASLSFGAIVQDLANKSTAKQSDIDDFPECSDDVADHVAIVLTTDTGAEVLGTMGDPFEIDLVDGQVFTEEVPELELGEGTYELQHFSVYNADGDLIWLAPRGGDMAQFVDTALPLTINLGAGVKKYVDVSVLCYDDRDVNEYGYLFFEFDTTEAFKFCFFANYCPPNGRHFPARYSVDITVDGVLLYNDVINETGTNEDGDAFADPLCFALPDLPEFEDDEDYISYTVTLLDWEGLYDAAPASISGTLSRSDVMANFDGENNVDYEHLRFGCDGGQTPGDDDDDDDGVPNDDDVCPNFDDNIDADDDGIPDGCDNCPEMDNSNQADGDGDEVGDVCDNCPDESNEGQVDSDGDGMGDACDPCPEVASGDDSDGDCIPNNEDPCVDDPNNECDVQEGCETAYMMGDFDFITEGDFTGNSWGWAEHFMDEGDDEYSYPIYAGAGQNDISKGDLIGYVYLTADGDDFTIVVDYNTGVDVNDLHVYIGDTPLETSAPGQFDNQDDSMTYEFTDADGDFWFAVHAEACYDDDDEED